MTVMRFCFVGVIVYGLSFWLTGSAAAEHVSGREHQARRLFQKARADFDAGAFDVAAGEFEAGYALTPLPLFLYNAGQAHRRAGHEEKAVSMFRRYLDEAPGAPEREEIEAWLRTRPATLTPDAVPTQAVSPTPAVSPQTAPAVSATPVISPLATPAVSHRRGLAVGLGIGGGVLVAGALVLGLTLGLPHGPPSTDLGNLRPLP